MRQEERIRRMLWAQQEQQKIKLAEEAVQPPVEIVEKQTARIMARSNADDLVVDVVSVGEIVPLKEEDQSVQEEPVTSNKFKKKSVK